MAQGTPRTLIPSAQTFGVSRTVSSLCTALRVDRRNARRMVMWASVESRYQASMEE